MPVAWELKHGQGMHRILVADAKVDRVANFN
jgi:hypothetical protein